MSLKISPTETTVHRDASEDVAELTGRRGRDLILFVVGLVLAGAAGIFVAAQATRPPSPAGSRRPARARERQPAREPRPRRTHHAS